MLSDSLSDNVLNLQSLRANAQTDIVLREVPYRYLILDHLPFLITRDQALQEMASRTINIYIGRCPCKTTTALLSPVANI